MLKNPCFRNLVSNFYWTIYLLLVQQRVRSSPIVANNNKIIMKWWSSIIFSSMICEISIFCKSLGNRHIQEKILHRRQRNDDDDVAEVKTHSKQRMSLTNGRIFLSPVWSYGYVRHLMSPKLKADTLKFIGFVVVFVLLIFSITWMALKDGLRLWRVISLFSVSFNSYTCFDSGFS